MDLPRTFPGSAFSEYYGAQSPFYANYTGTGSDLYARVPPYQPSYDVTGSRPSTGALSNNVSPGSAAFPKSLPGADNYVTSPWSVTSPPSTTSGWDAGKTDALSMGRAAAPMTSVDMAHHHDAHHQHGGGGGGGGHHAKRKRKTTPQQRLAANIRERRRMCNLNNAFDRLRRRVPAFPHEKRLSRIQTLKLAITYISFMTEIVSGQDIQLLLKQNAENNKHVVWQPYELGESGSESGFI